MKVQSDSFKLRFIVFIILLSSSLACSKKKNENNDVPIPDKIEKHFLQGDPIVIIEGAKLQRETPFRKENLPKYSGYRFAGGVFFGQYSPPSPEREKGDLEKENESNQREDLPSDWHRFGFRPSKEEGGVQYYHYTNGGEDTPMEFKVNLKKVQGDGGEREVEFLELVKVYEVDVEVLHYSIKKEGPEGFSILAKGHFGDYQNSLIALYFTKENPKSAKIQKVDKQFNYLFGKGIRVSWDPYSSIDLKICGQGAQTIKDEIYRGADVWSEIPKHYLDIRISTPETYYPFSDLNEHCIYYIDSYLKESDPEIRNYGTTYFTANLRSQRMIDSDIFLWKKEFQKLNSPLGSLKEDIISRKIIGTVAHEVGHFLGLDHKFDGTPSVMSYNSRDHYSLNEYDKKAISLLYSKGLETQFYQFCLKNENSTEVEAIYKGIRARKGEANIPRDCLKISDALAGTKSLDLSHSGPGIVRHLIEARKLQRLTLKGSKLNNLEFLKDLTELWTLDLENNLIEDLSPLSKLIFLESINLRQNNIEAIGPLSKMTWLKEIDLSDNPKLRVLSPLKDLRGVTSFKFDFDLNKSADFSCPMDAKSAPIRKFCEEHFPSGEH